MIFKNITKNKLMVKDILVDLQKAEDVKEKVNSQINKRSGMSPMDVFSSPSPLLLPSESISTSGTFSPSFSASPTIIADFDYTNYRRRRIER